jgi:gluconolactonase
MPLAVFRRTFFAFAAFALAAYAVAADEKKEVREVKVEDITLSVPADWKQREASNQLRLAEFAIPPAEGDKEPTEMVVSHFGGGGGGVDANIDRWIGQFASDGRQAKVAKGESKQGAYYFVDIAGTYNMPVGPPILRQSKPLSDARMLGVILEVEGKGNYFLKMAGPEKTVSAQEEALRASIGGDAKSEKPHELK